MAKILGIGAVMIYADDPSALAQWYAKVLGIKTALNAQDGWYQGDIIGAKSKQGPIHFGLHSPEGTAAAGGHVMMINYEVDDLNRFLKHLEQKGVRVTRTLEEDYGSFAYFDDPEGNPIEVWARTRT
jgi:predicted enzyme related to lactoylglutathione lyase